MKILVMTGIYPPHFLGGAELSCQIQVKELQKRGHEVFVLTSHWGIAKPEVAGDVYRWLEYDRISLEPNPTAARHDPFRLRRRLKQISRALFLSKNYDIAKSLVMTIQPDIVFVWQMECTSISPILAAQDLGVPSVIRLPDYWLASLRTEICQEPNPLKRWYRAAIIGLRSFDRLDTSHMLPISEATKQSYIAAGFPARHMHVIPEGICSKDLIILDELPYLLQPQHDREMKLLFAGRVVREKGPDVAIEALAHLVREPAMDQARLDIIGSGPEDYIAELKGMIRNLDLESRVTFLGKIARQEILQRYKQYHALLFTSRWVEPFGVTVIEAMGRGVPVIATNHGGPAEIIRDGINGLLVPPDRPVMLANAVKRLMQEPGLFQKIRYAALETVRGKYTTERIVDQIEEYLQLVSKSALAECHQSN